MAKTKVLQIFRQILLFILCFAFQGFCLETDTINSTLSVKDPDSIVSQGQVFRLGFFSPANTTNRYLGIFYVFSERDVIWVANRDRPLTDSSGTVTISADGELVLKNGQNHTVWSTNTTNAPTNTTAQILDTGNLVLRDISTGNVVWDCFSHPTNVWVPTMRVTHNIKTGKKRVWSSWKNGSDPEPGIFTSGIEVLNYITQLFIWKHGRPHYRTGPWNGLIFIGIQDKVSPYLEGFIVANESDTFYLTAPERAVITKVTQTSGGSLEHVVWNNQTKSWVMAWMAPKDECEIYGKCGPFGTCNAEDSPICSCLKGFEPVNKEEWRKGNWTNGCGRKTQLQCDQSNNITRSGDGFLRLPFIKVPDFAQRNLGKRVDECRNICLRNCSCIAYSHDSNIGCMFWSGKLIDILQFSGVGPDLYLRLASSELDDKENKLIIIIPVVTGLSCMSICAFVVWCWLANRKGAVRKKDQKLLEAKQIFTTDSNVIVLDDESESIDIKELPLFTFDTLAEATNQFEDNNLLGKGGFGSVYLGKLENGKEIAIKRLSEVSAQGVKEFMNEVVVISKLQHRNLVRLVGCCIEREEKMLIYEYMPNKSLALCLFATGHPSRRVLDWKKWFSIIEGLARGLLYLHKDSILRIIHRDLKPSNVLLDGDWNPKISDFGMARIFGGNQDQANTATVVGTYGYMAPEYAMEGRFSEKSDVYSFGVLMLEIASGEKNTHYYNEEWSLSLLGLAWKLWNENNGMAFADKMVATPNFQEEIMRCIHIALLCVQESPKDRPTIQNVLSMLSGEFADLPLPEQPVFAEKWNRSHVGFNELSMTALDGR